jgi:hypothetical protein
MAPELALNALQSERGQGTVLDPMCGSGTVLRTAVEAGHEALGFDMDPLAVLMSSVWTDADSLDRLGSAAEEVVREARQLDSDGIYLPWIDDDQETLDFVDFWFADRQKEDLRRIVSVIHTRRDRFFDALKLSLSRIIVTKKKGASLAWDVSHSRPHRVALTNEYDVMEGFIRAAREIEKRLASSFSGAAQVLQGDARNLSSIPDKSVDLVVTSPPYLNAIDYLRGHRLALVWLGYRVNELRRIRSDSVGAERGLKLRDSTLQELAVDSDLSALSPRMTGIFWRYVEDISNVMKEVSRVLRRDARAVLVVGNSTVKGTFVDNAGVVRRAGLLHGLNLLSTDERELPASRRYLPPPSLQGASLDRRMRTEVVLEMEKVD